MVLAKKIRKELSEINELADPVVESMHEYLWGQEGRSTTKLSVELDGNVQQVEIVSASQTKYPVLVRQEYKEIAKEVDRQLDIVKTGGYDPEGFGLGLCIYGSPGIGKSYSLHYLRARALEQRQPVILTKTGDKNVLIHTEEGVYLIKIENLGYVWFSKPMLILCDSGKKVEPPDESFFDLTDAVLVHATSPKTGRYKEWTKQKEAMFFTLSIWDRPEFLQLCAIRQFYQDEKIVPNSTSFQIQTSEPILIFQSSTAKAAGNKFYYSAIEVFEYLGGIPRTCFHSAMALQSKTLRSADSFPNDWLKGRSVDTIFLGSNTGGSPDASENAQGDGYDQVVFIKPFGPSLQQASPSKQRFLATDFIDGLFMSALRTKDVKRQIEFAKDTGLISSFEGVIFEAFVLTRIADAQGAVMQVNFEREIMENLHLSMRRYNLESSPATFPMEKALFVPGRNFPSIDGFIFTPSTSTTSPLSSTVTLLQITINPKHDYKHPNFEKIKKLFPTLHWNTVTRWDYVWIVKDGSSGPRLVKKSREGQPNTDANSPSISRFGWAICNSEEFERML